MTELVQSIDSWPKAVVALAVCAAFAFVAKQLIKSLLGD